MTRQFEINEAVRQQVPLLIGLVGPSGGGKTGSALELAHGIQEVCGGDIGAVDTEAKRMLHYADAPFFSDKSRRFKFKHMPFGAPFNPGSYQQAIEAMVRAGVKTCIVDSMSHEHEGPGGILEMHEALVTKFSKGVEADRDRNNFRAWAEPKAERRALINFLLQQPVNFISCFRAKEKLKMLANQANNGKKEAMPQGWQPIAGEEYVFEMTLNCLLLPGANGVPTWNPEEKAERQMIKLPEQFKGIVTPGRALSAAMGRQLAEWAKGGPVQEAPKPAGTPASAQSSVKLSALEAAAALHNSATLDQLKGVFAKLYADKAKYQEKDWLQIEATKDEVKQYLIEQGANA